MKTSKEKQPQRLISIFDRFRFAATGIKKEWRRGFSFRIQVLCAAALIAFCIVFRPPAVWCAIFALNVSLVLGLELFNSAMESLIDHLHPEIHPEIGFVKDCLAGGVLVASIGSVVVFLLFLYQQFM